MATVKPGTSTAPTAKSSMQTWGESTSKTRSNTWRKIQNTNNEKNACRGAHIDTDHGPYTPAHCAGQTEN
eukprot:8685713-Lingulodinium_polyedra.AAC.1